MEKTLNGFLNHLFCVLCNKSQKKNVISRVNNVLQNLIKNWWINVAIEFTLHHLLLRNLINITALHCFIQSKNAFSMNFSNILMKIKWQYFLSFIKFSVAIRIFPIAYQQKHIYKNFLKNEVYFFEVKININLLSYSNWRRESDDWKKLRTS